MNVTLKFLLIFVTSHAKHAQSLNIQTLCITLVQNTMTFLWAKHTQYQTHGLILHHKLDQNHYSIDRSLSSYPKSIYSMTIICSPIMCDTPLNCTVIPNLELKKWQHYIQIWIHHIEQFRLSTKYSKTRPAKTKGRDRTRCCRSTRYRRDLAAFVYFVVDDCPTVCAEPTNVNVEKRKWKCFTWWSFVRSVPLQHKFNASKHFMYNSHTYDREWSTATTTPATATTNTTKRSTNYPIWTSRYT